MAKPELENGHTQIANEILEHLIKAHLSPNQWQVLLCIIRKTYGFHKKVDYIANSQIVEATGLCKAVVSRALHTLKDRNIITRKGKLLGFQKDWETWGELAEQSTKEKLAIPSTELAEQSTGLAILQTKVSSPAVAQKIKDTLTKEKLQKKGDTSFNDYSLQLKEEYPELDFDFEMRKFHLYYSEGKKKPKRPKLALLNWMKKASKWQAEQQKDGKHGTARKDHRGPSSAEEIGSSIGAPLR